MHAPAMHGLIKFSLSNEKLSTIKGQSGWPHNTQHVKHVIFIYCGPLGRSCHAGGSRKTNSSVEVSFCLRGGICVVSQPF